jgi:serine/threonine protein kinase
MRDIAGARRIYDHKADIWSLGAILYFMTYGEPPIYHIRAAEPPAGQRAARDPLLVDLLHRTLVLHPSMRADMNTLLQHPYTLR